MTEKRFRVHELAKYNYSDIGEYIDENHTDRPLRNDEVVELLNELNDKCIVLEIENKAFEDGATKYVELYHKSLKENKQLRELLENGLEVSQVEIDEELERMNNRGYEE